MKDSILEIKEELKKNLSDYRYNHSLRVMEEAKKLAIHYNLDKNEVKKCELCGLLHDIAKEYNSNENKKIIEEYNIPQKTLDMFSPKTIHGLIGSLVVYEKYHFSEDMILAIKYHTTGYVGMTLLAKIVYLADKIEKGKDYPFIEEERKLAYLDIDKAVIFCLENQIRKLKKENKNINKLALDTLNSLKKQIN